MSPGSPKSRAYGLVIADLKKRLAAVERAIAALEALQTAETAKLARQSQGEM